MRGGRVGFLAVFHVGTVTQLAQPLLVGLAALGLAQLGTGRIAQPLGRFGVGSPAQHLHQVVRPALDRGAVVICDRYLDSMLAYQGAGRVLDVEDVAAIGAWATGGLVPDLTVLLDMDPARAVGVKRGRDRLEQAGDGFHARVRQGFLDLAARAPERYLVLPARTGREHLARLIRHRLTGLGIEGLRG